MSAIDEATESFIRRLREYEGMSTILEKREHVTTNYSLATFAKFVRRNGVYFEGKLVCFKACWDPSL